MNKGVDNQELRGFLLGSADDEIVEEVSARLVVDEEFAEYVSMVEESLIEEFLDGELNERETRLFGENFMTSPARLRILEEISAIRRAASVLSDRTETPAAAKPRQRLIPSWVFAVAFLALLGGGFLLWRTSVTVGPTQREIEFASINAGDVSAEAAKRGLAATVLIPGSLRGGGAGPKVTAGSEIFLNLALPDGVNESNLDLEIRRGEKAVFRQKALPVVRNHVGMEIRALVPALEKGSYRIRIGKDITYELVVE